MSTRDSHQYQGQGRRKTRRRGWSQASTRRPIVCFDQHGRRWTNWVSLKTGMPTGIFVPDFHAPWYPDQQYMKLNPENSAELFIAYRPLLSRRKAAMETFHRKVVAHCRAGKVTPPAFGEYDGHAVVDVVGRPPKPFQPVIAAMQNNSFILGATDVVDTRLERYVRLERSIDRLIDGVDYSDVSFADAKAEHERGASDTTDLGDEFMNGGSPTTKHVRELGQSPGTSRPHTNQRLDAGEIETPEFAGALDEIASDEIGEINEIELLDELEEQLDPEAAGGRTVAPQNAERAERQAPRRPTASATRSKHGGARSKQRASQRAGRPTLASGAEPVIGHGGVGPETE